MQEAYRTADELRREIADLKIRLAFQQAFEEEVEGVLRKAAQPDADTIERVRANEGQALQRIAEGFSRPKQRRSRGDHRLSRRWKIAALLAAMLIISVVSALATAQLIRVGILKLDIQAYDHHTVFQLAQSGDAVTVPEGWTGVFYPAFIPADFAFSRLDGKEAVYRNGGQTLRFGEGTYGVAVDVDTEDAQVETVPIHDTTATLVEKNGRVSLIWSEHNRLFTLHFDGERTTAIDIAQSVILIE